MPPLPIVFTARAEREFRALDSTIAKRIKAKLEALASSPDAFDTTELQGIDGRRLRVGDYRVIYTIEAAAESPTEEPAEPGTSGEAKPITRLVVLHLGHRKDVYD